MKLSGERFNRFLSRIGQDVIWRQSFSCPCVSDHSGAADPQCAICDGRGRLWNEGVPGYCGITNQSSDPKYRDPGVVLSGDVFLIIPSNTPLFEMGHLDRLTMVNTTDQFSLNLKRGYNDNLFGRSVISVDRVFWKSVDGLSIVEGGIPSVSENGTLTWTGNAPAPGTQYSISGRQRVEYFAYQEIPNNRFMHFGEDLPKRMHMRRFDLWGR